MTPLRGAASKTRGAEQAAPQVDQDGVVPLIDRTSSANTVRRQVTEIASATYDVLERMTHYEAEKSPTSNTRWVDLDWRYDLVGNIRNLHADYSNEVNNLTAAAQDDWYLYDAMDRVTVLSV